MFEDMRMCGACMRSPYKVSNAGNPANLLEFCFPSGTPEYLLEFYKVWKLRMMNCCTTMKITIFK